MKGLERHEFKKHIKPWFNGGQRNNKPYLQKFEDSCEIVINVF